MGKYYMIMLYVTITCQITSHGCHMMVSYDECGKVVHRLGSSCISSIENQIRTPSSSPC